jgi:hypothetical protein
MHSPNVDLLPSASPGQRSVKEACRHPKRYREPVLQNTSQQNKSEGFRSGLAQAQTLFSSSQCLNGATH